MPVACKKFLAGAAIIVALLIPIWPSFEKPASPMDEGSLLLYPELILKGQIPYRDFETFYGPANLVLLSTAYASFGTSIFTERVVGLLYRILVLIALFVLIQRWSASLAAGCLIVAGFLLMPAGLTASAWIGGIMCLLWALCCIAKPDSGRRCFWGGILSGIALLYRVDLAPAVVIASLPLFLLMNPGGRWRYMGGAALALLPLGWLMIVAGPQQLLNNLFLFPVIYSNPARRLPFSAAVDPVRYLLFGHVIATLINLAAGAMAIRLDRRAAAPRLLLGMALLGLGVTHQALQRIDIFHVLFTVFISLGLLPLSLLVLNGHRSNERPGSVQALLATGSILILLAIAVPVLVVYWRGELSVSWSQQPANAAFVARSGRAFPVVSLHDARDINLLLKQLEELAQPNQRLFVGPADLRRTNYNDTYIYHLMPRLQPATYFLEMNPGSANRPGSQLATNVASADWLVLNHASDTWDEPNDSARYRSDAPMRVVRAEFELCNRYGAYELYRHKQVAVGSGR
jgi:hypothetical protein